MAVGIQMPDELKQDRVWTAAFSKVLETFIVIEEIANKLVLCHFLFKRVMI